MRVEGSCGPASSCTIVTGTYLLIRRPIQLIFTWIREEEEWPETTVQWDLEENAGTTIVRVTHSGPDQRCLAKRANAGWPMIQQLLKGYIETAVLAGRKVRWEKREIWHEVLVDT